MCDIGLIIGLASGAAQAGGEQETARKNKKIIRDQQIAEMAVKQRELIVEKNAANKEGYKASLEADRNVSYGVAMGEGMRGISIGQRAAEQKRQGALNIYAAEDRADAAEFNYEQGTTIDAIEARNKMAVHTPSKAATFANIISSGLGNYGSFG